MFYFLFSLAFVSTVHSVLVNGPCPDIKPISYLNLTGLAGTWYEIGKYQNDFESRGDCASITITPRDVGADYKHVDIANQNQVILQGVVNYAPEAGTSGVLNYYSSDFIASEGTNFIHPFFLKVVYDKYCILYECAYDETKKTRRDYAWVMARVTKFDNDTQKEVDAFLKSNSLIDASKMSWEHFNAEACKVKS